MEFRRVLFRSQLAACLRHQRQRPLLLQPRGRAADARRRLWADRQHRLGRGQGRQSQRQRLFGVAGGGDRDRKSVVSGKSVSVRVDLGGRRIIKKKKKNTKEENAQKINKK